MLGIPYGYAGRGQYISIPRCESSGKAERELEREDEGRRSENESAVKRLGDTVRQKIKSAGKD